MAKKVKAKALECKECGEQFTKQVDLNAHILTQHGGQDTKTKNRDAWKFQCTVPNCTAKFPSKGKHDNHVHTHAPSKEFKCSVCAKLFQTPNSRAQHQKVHTNDCRLKCYFCQKYFSTTQHLHEHMKLHLQEFEFRCQVCGKEYIRKRSLTAHVTKIHETQRPHACSDCPRSFDSPFALIRHSGRVHRRGIKSNTSLRTSIRKD